MADDNVQLHPAMERMALRRRMMAAVDQMLEAVDLLVRELDADTPDADLEPSLGAREYPHQLQSVPTRFIKWADGARDDREGDGFGKLDSDFEPSLGAPPAMDQRRWARGGTHDLEQEHDGREPQCEDEGAQCDDEGVDSDREPDPWRRT